MRLGAGPDDLARDQVHGRRADEPRDEFVFRRLVKFKRRADLRDTATRQDNDPSRQCHRLDLVVGDVDHRRIRHRLFQLRDLDPGGDAQCRVKVRERLVKQIDLRVAHDGASDRHPLPLTPRQRLGQAVEIIAKLQDLCGAVDPLVDLCLGHLGDLQREGHVVAHRHVRIKRVGLEHHRDAALRGRHIVDHHSVDFKVTAGDPFQPCDHAQKGGLAAARGTDKDDQFSGLDLKVDILKDGDGTAIGLLHIRQCQIGHFPLPFLCRRLRSSAGCHLTEPASRPRTRNRCRLKNTASGTAMDTKAAAARMPQSPPRDPRRSSAILTVMTLASSAEGRNTLATSRSFQVQRNWKIAKEASAGSDSGRMILMKI
ncbi:hypothetical protein SSE37_00815 [Sagittula stellata E-37]|uniref:Uncharacterized protein n=1 Tax=Sagittula stellata (strain ATCC 700073 / DSM 11524 / E-37) TaxID=388399 RepID=A3K7K9_SAGS3|nr:hypothetical protein SSE37_00815 [Sagittula stellata E-37]